METLDQGVSSIPAEQSEMVWDFIPLLRMGHDLKQIVLLLEIFFSNLKSCSVILFISINSKNTLGCLEICCLILGSFLLISNSFPLWSKNGFYNFIPFQLFILFMAQTWSVLTDGSCALEKNMDLLLMGVL